MATKEFSVHYLKNELGLPYDSDLVISDTITDNGRWTIYHDLIFKDPADNKIYQVSYEEGATEMQPEKPWEYDTTVTGTEMKYCKTIVNQYVPVDSDIPDLADMLQNAAEQIAISLDNSIIDDLTHRAYMQNRINTILTNTLFSEEVMEHTESSIEVNDTSSTTIDPILEELGAVLVETSSNIDMEKFQKFFEKLKKNLDDVFYLEDETTILDLPAEPSPSDTFIVRCEDGSTNTYVLSDLYEKYLENKANAVSKPVKSIVSDIEEEYDEHSFELD